MKTRGEEGTAGRLRHVPRRGCRIAVGLEGHHPSGPGYGDLCRGQGTVLDVLPHPFEEDAEAARVDSYGRRIGELARHRTDHDPDTTSDGRGHAGPPMGDPGAP